MPAQLSPVATGRLKIAETGAVAFVSVDKLALGKISTGTTSTSGSTWIDNRTIPIIRKNYLFAGFGISDCRTAAVYSPI